jgi:SAM-dependent methyltransferase
MSKSFWNKEYRKNRYLTLSDEPAEDLEKFTRWLERREGRKTLNITSYVLDIGCGNGRNIIHLARNFGVHGRGFDISAEAIRQAKEEGKGLAINFEVGSVENPLTEEDDSVDIVLDMVVSHVLPLAGREKLRDEVFRVLKIGGLYFFKTFLLEDDLNAKRMIKEHPAGEENSFIHPKLGNFEHVWTEEELYKFFSDKFDIEKIEKSHMHMLRGKPFKRRHIIAYLRKK